MAVLVYIIFKKLSPYVSSALSFLHAASTGAHNPWLSIYTCVVLHPPHHQAGIVRRRRSPTFHRTSVSWAGGPGGRSGSSFFRLRQC